MEKVTGIGGFFFRGKNLETLAGVVMTVDDTVYPNGRFAHLQDPEGNLIELWEAAGTDAHRPLDQQKQG